MRLFFCQWELFFLLACLRLNHTGRFAPLRGATAMSPSRCIAVALVIVVFLRLRVADDSMQPASNIGNQPLIPLEEGWGQIKAGIQRLEDLLATDFDGSTVPFTNAEYMAIYT